MKFSDTRQLRSVFGKFATGVTVVTFEREGEVLGMTVNSFASVSLEPPMVLFCPALSCRFAEQAVLGSKFNISILAHHQKDVCLHFAGRPCLDLAPWTRQQDVLPVVDGCLAHLCCELEALHRHGDHYVAVGRVLEWEISSEEAPLMFFSGYYPTLS